MEKQIIQLKKEEGLADKEIAARFKVPVYKVQYMLRKLRRKYGCRNNAQLIHRLS